MKGNERGSEDSRRCHCPQMVYEAVRDIAAGEELLLGVREPLQLQDMLGENTTEDRSDRETGEYQTRCDLVARKDACYTVFSLRYCGCYRFISPRDGYSIEQKPGPLKNLLFHRRRDRSRASECSPTDVITEARGKRTDNQTH